MKILNHFVQFLKVEDECIEEFYFYKMMSLYKLIRT